MDGNANGEIYVSRFHPETQVRLSRREVAYVFDLGRPLEPQFARALRDARGVQAHRVRTGEVEVEGVRRRADKYVLYLRLIDAEDAGVDRKQIKNELLGNIPEQYPDNRRTVAFKDARRAAHRLRDVGYRDLGAT
jgi:hypothetical protein